MNNDRFFDGAWFLEFVTEKLKRCLEAVEDSLRKGKEEITGLREKKIRSPSILESVILMKETAGCR